MAGWRRLQAHTLAALACAAGLVCTPQAARAQATYEAALARYQAQDLVGALRIVQDVLVARPQHVPARLLLARGLLDGGNAVSAAKAVRQAMADGAPAADAVPLLARITLLMGDGAQLLVGPEFRHEGLPPEARHALLLLKLEAAMDLRDAATVGTLLAQAQAVAGSDPAAWLAAVRWHLRQGEIPAAQAALAQAARRAPASADVAFHRGSLAEARGTHGEALAAYTAALQAQAGHLAARVARARLQLQQGRVEAARADLQALQQAAADDPRTLYLQAMLARQSGQPDEARRALVALTRRIDALPMPLLRATPQMLLVNGLAHMGLEQPALARPYLTAHHELQGGGEAARLLAQCLLALGEGDAAIAALTQQLRREPADSRSAALLVRTLLADQDLPRAAAAARAAAAQGDGAELRVATALVQAAQGELAAAERSLLAALRLQPELAEAHALLIGVLQRSGQGPRALALAQAAVKAQPRDAALQRLLGDAWLAQGQPQQARSAYRAALQAEPREPAALLALARLDRREGRLDEAAQGLTLLLEAAAPAPAPAHGGATAPVANAAASAAANAPSPRIRGSLRATWRSALQELAALHEQRGQGRQALERYRQLAADAAVGEPGPVLVLADFLIRQQQGDAALAALRALRSDDAQVQWLTGQAQRLRGDLVAARQAYTHAGRLGAQDAALQQRIASAQLQLGDAAGAAHSLSRLEGAAADDPAVLLLRTRAEIARPDLAQAQLLVDRMLRQWPRRALGHQLQGELALARQDPQAAVQALQRAFDLEPTTEHLLGLFGAVAARDGAAAALGLLETWLARQPADWLARNTLSEAYARLGRFAEAQRSYEAQLALMPPTAAVRHNLAVVMLQNGDARALAEAEQALQAEPGNPHFLATAGWAALAAGRTEPALARLREARRLLPAHPSVRYYLAAALQRAGRTAEARAELAPLLQGGPAFAEREQALRLAAQLAGAR